MRGVRRLLVVDDEPLMAESLAEYLRTQHYEVQTARSGQEALEMLSRQQHASDARPFAAAIVDIAMPGMTGLQLLEHVTREYPQTAVIMLTGYGTIESAVQAVRSGATDYLTKPVIDAELTLSLERALRQHAMATENVTLKQRLDERFGLESIVGKDARMGRIYQLIDAVAPTKTTVLMMGESGTGKSLIAKAIHQRSPRRDKPFVELACGSIPETLLESELFGHVRGAFTGAHADKAGKFLQADGGTIFLDEINSAPPAMQLKLLRVLQDRKFEAVGGSETIEVDVRVILAGNVALEELVAKGQFRQDLYYRVNVVKIDVPPLRQRTSDIPILAEHFLQMHAQAIGRTIVGFDQGAMRALMQYAFPGNVRELSNIVERACVLATRPTITVEDLPGHVADPGLLHPTASSSVIAAPAIGPANLHDALRAPEKQLILDALEKHHWNKAKAAGALGINRTTLYKKMRALGIDLGGGESGAA